MSSVMQQNARSCRKVWRLRTTGCYGQPVDDVETEAESGAPYSDLPERRVTINQIVAWNLLYFRRVAGLTQEELGDRLGWSKVVVSAAERSWGSKRIRQFSVDDVLAIAIALGVPVIGLFLPPDDDGTGARYLLEGNPVAGADMTALLSRVLPAYEGDEAVMVAYRTRLMKIAPRYEEPRQRLLAERIVADARERAESLELDAQTRHREAMSMLTDAIGPLVQQRVELERRVDDLRAFERLYRRKLREYFREQLKELGDEAEEGDS
jgi:transcriptional regulator with XRE-family HTH domain